MSDSKDISSYQTDNSIGYMLLSNSSTVNLIGLLEMAKDQLRFELDDKFNKQ